MSSEDVSQYMLMISNLCSALTNYWTTVIAFAAITSLIFIPLVNSIDTYVLVISFLTLRSLILLIAKLNMTSGGKIQIVEKLSGRLKVGKEITEQISKFSRKSLTLQLGLASLAAILISVALLMSEYGENYLLVEGLLIISIIVINANILYTLIEPAEVALPAASWSLGSIFYALVEMYYTGVPLVYVLSIVVTSDVFAILGLNAKGIGECVNAMKSQER